MRSFSSHNRIVRSVLICTVFAIALTTFQQVIACPFCSAVNLTFSEQLNSNDVVVIAKLIKLPEPNVDPDAELPKAEFEIVDLVKGEKWVRKGMKFRSLLVGRYPEGEKFLVMGVDPPSVAWTTPQKASERLITYLKKLPSLPEKGAARLEFFQKFFEDKESFLAFDAYDEFARAPYEDVVALKPNMDRDQLVKWILDPETSINRRRLYFTMLGVCGGDKDVKMLEELIESGDRKKQAGLDALIACYLNLKGADGVGLIEDTFIKNQEVDYVDTLAAVSALRFHGTEVDFVPKERIVKAIRLLLDRPKMADMIIPDLARWEDWSVMERLVQMFKDADEDTNWLRVPVITYLRACPKPEAEKYIEELAKIDPDAVRRADFFRDFADDAFDDEEDEGTEDSAEESVDKEPKKVEAVNGGEDKQTLTSIPSSTSPVAELAVRKVPIVGEETVDAGPFLRENPSEVSSVPTVGTTTSMASEPPALVAQSDVASATPAPVVAQVSATRLTMTVIFAPMLISLAIFVLLWSVINGWFERLIV